MSGRSNKSSRQTVAGRVTKYECVACDVSVSWPVATEREPTCLRCRVQMRRVGSA